jgi:hypothetical protein
MFHPLPLQLLWGSAQLVRLCVSAFVNGLLQEHRQGLLCAGVHFVLRSLRQYLGSTVGCVTRHGVKKVDVHCQQLRI